MYQQRKGIENINIFQLTIKVMWLRNESKIFTRSWKMSFYGQYIKRTLILTHKCLSVILEIKNGIISWNWFFSSFIPVLKTRFYTRFDTLLISCVLYYVGHKKLYQGSYTFMYNFARLYFDLIPFWIDYDNNLSRVKWQ